MGHVIDLCHIRRSRRLFALLVDRFGVESFLLGREDEDFRLDPDKIRQAVSLAASWLELRTGRPATRATVIFMQQELRRRLIRALAEHMVGAGF
ncbi:MAG: hypothetical protein ABIJ09_04165 [Pseudomonadota bacterium]